VEGENVSFFTELKRRNVFKVAVAYSVASWLILQIVDLVLENINAPDWVMQVFMLGLAVGFPIAIIIAWAFEVTPEGVKLEKNVDRNLSIAKKTGHQLNRGIIVILSMIVVLLLTERFRDEVAQQRETATPSSESSTDAAEIDTGKSIAVLPFRDMSANQDQAYFGEGIAEELLNALVKIDDLHVASRTSAFSLADENLDIPTIASRLGVDHILEGSIRTSGQKVRVTAQLIEVSKDVHLWSETYDGSLDDIFKIQDQITSQIADAMKIQLGGEHLAPISATLTSNAEAYQLYLQGRHLWRQRNAGSLKEAIRLFKDAVELDPAFHRAWSNQAIAYLNLPDYDRSYSVSESYELGLAAAEKALEIWPESTQALIITANYHQLHCDFSEAARLFKTAISYNPEDPTAHHWYAILLHTAGHTKLALEHIRKARQIDPLISAVIAIEAEVSGTLGEYERAGELHRAASSLGLYGGSLYPVGMNFLHAGEFEQGIELIRDGWVGEAPSLAGGRELFIQALLDPSKQQAFEEYIGKADESQPYQTFDNLYFLTILGSPYTFEHQADVKCVMADGQLWNESFKAQRSTPEFFEFMERAGIVEYWREFGWPDDCASLDQSLAECG
jgi:TolB-like protein/Tfp pilus assembly protein PilF